MTGVTFVKLFEVAAADPRLVKVNGKTIHRELEWPYLRDQATRESRKARERLRGFLFAQNGKFSWLDDADSDAVINVGRSLAGIAGIGGFNDTYITSRRHGGFGVYFFREDDAKTFLHQGILNPATYQPGNLLTAYGNPAGQKPSQKLPGPEDRLMSDPFPGRFAKDLFWYEPTGGEFRRTYLGW